MNKTTEEILEEYKNTIMRFIDASRNAEPVTYRSDCGRVYDEKPGEYNDYMVRAMATDMFHLYTWAYLNHPDNEFDKTMRSWSCKFTVFNTELMRMIDDIKGNRPIKPFFKNCKGERLVEEIGKVFKSGVLNDHPDKERVKKRLEMWADRILYQFSWAYCLEQKKYIRKQIFDAELKEADADGNIISGLSDDDERLVKTFCEMRQLLLKIFIKIPVNTPEHAECLDELERLHLFTEALVEGKMEELLKRFENDNVTH